MLVSVRDKFCWTAVKRILLNGFSQTYAMEADSTRGYIIRPKRGSETGLILHINGVVCMEELNGRVKIEFNPGWWMDAEGFYVYHGQRMLKD